MACVSGLFLHLSVCSLLHLPVYLSTKRSQYPNKQGCWFWNLWPPQRLPAWASPALTVASGSPALCMSLEGLRNRPRSSVPAVHEFSLASTSTSKKLLESLAFREVPQRWTLLLCPFPAVAAPVGLPIWLLISPSRAPCWITLSFMVSYFQTNPDPRGLGPYSVYGVPPRLEVEFRLPKLTVSLHTCQCYVSANRTWPVVTHIYRATVLLYPLIPDQALLPSPPLIYISPDRFLFSRPITCIIRSTSLGFSALRESVFISLLIHLAETYWTLNQLALQIVRG